MQQKSASLKDQLEAFLQNLIISRRLSDNTVSAYKSDVSHFLAFLEQQNITSATDEKLNPLLLQDYLAKLREDALKKNSFSRKYSSINAFFKFLLEESLIAQNPLRKTSKPKTEKTIPETLDFKIIEEFIRLDLNRQESNTIITKAKKTKNDKQKILKDVFVIFLAYSGLRVSEVCSLKIKEIQHIIEKILIKKNNPECIFDETSVLFQIKGKGQKERLVPFFLQNLDYLEKYLSAKELMQGKKSEYLFPSKTAKHKHITRRYIFKILNIFATQFHKGINIHPHLFRHSFATNLLKKGLNLRNLQELLGHSNISTTAIYTKVEDETIASILKDKHPIFKPRT